MRNKSWLTLMVMAMCAVLWVGCGSDDPDPPGPVTPDLYEPGTEWGGGDWPTLVSPEFGEDVIIGEAIPRFTAPYSGDFIPTVNCVQGTDWVMRVTRPEALCTAWQQWVFNTYYWSDRLPIMDYNFNFHWTCLVSNTSLKDYDVSWPLTENKDIKFMENGVWISVQNLPTISRSHGGNGYRIDRQFTLPAQGQVFLSMSHHWVQGIGADSDRTFPEGPIEITHRNKSGVSLSTTETFTKTTGWNAGIDIKGISAGLNQTFETSTSHTVTLEEEVETIETRNYEVPPNEQWRYIQLYGVERYTFTDADGKPWESPRLVLRSLGSVDNKVRNVLMIVKYRAGASRPYDTQIYEGAAVVSR